MASRSLQPSKRVAFRIHHIQKCCYVVDTLPRHLLPKSPRQKAEEISAKNVLNPLYRDQADPNPFLHGNRLHRQVEYERPLAVRWSDILQISKEKIAKLMEEHPELCDIPDSEAQIKRVAEYLSDTFGGASYMRTMIMRAPLLLDAEIPYLDHQIHQIVQHLSDHVIDDKCSDANKPERIQFVLDMIRRQSMILTENIDGEVIPRILFLKQLLNPYELTQLLLQLSSSIVMSFHRLIRIAFIQQQLKTGNDGKRKLMEISNKRQMNRVSLKELPVNEQHLGLIEKQIKNESIGLDEILKLPPKHMAKVFRGYALWLHRQIEENYYYHPLLAQRDLLKLEHGSVHSEPILALIDSDEDVLPLIEGQTQEMTEDELEAKAKREKFHRRQEIKQISTTIRELEMLVGDVYKSHIFKNSVFQ